MSGHGHITVDTSRMADALDLVRSGVSDTHDAVGDTARAVKQTVHGIKDTTSAVNETSNAVTAMMAAVTAAERDAADRVSRNVSTGFLGLISSQLMQKKIEAQTVMQSKCQVLGHYNRQLGRLKQQLEGDFHRITARYAKIISQLNDNLKSRVYQLDAPAAEVSDEGYMALDKRVLVSAAPLPLLEQDVLALSSQVCVSRCKESCMKSLPNVKSFVVQLKKLKQVMDSSVRPVRRDRTGRISMPVVVMEAEDANVIGAKKLDVVFGDKEEQKSLANRIRASFDETKGMLKWRTCGSARDIVVGKIDNFIQKNGVPERTQKVLHKLVEASFWQEMEVNG